MSADACSGLSRGRPRLLRHRHLRCEKNRQMPWEERRRGIFPALIDPKGWGTEQPAEAPPARA